MTFHRLTQRVLAHVPSGCERPNAYAAHVGWLPKLNRKVVRGDGLLEKVSILEILMV